MSDTLEIVCPCCNTRLSVDAETGAILHHQQPKITEKTTLEEAMRSQQARQGEVEDRFRKALEDRGRQEDILQKKFREAQKRAEKDPNKPRSPFDLD